MSRPAELPTPIGARRTGSASARGGTDSTQCRRRRSLGELEACPSLRGDWAQAQRGRDMRGDWAQGPRARRDWTRGGCGALSRRGQWELHGEAAAAPARPGGRGPGSARGHRCVEPDAARRAQPRDLPPRQVRPSGGGEASRAGSRARWARGWTKGGGQLHWQSFFDPRRPPRSGGCSFVCSRRCPPTAPRPRSPWVSLPARPALAGPGPAHQPLTGQPSAEPRPSPRFPARPVLVAPPRPSHHPLRGQLSAEPRSPPRLLIGPSVVAPPLPASWLGPRVPTGPFRACSLLWGRAWGPSIESEGVSPPVGGPPELASPIAEAQARWVKSALRSQGYPRRALVQLPDDGSQGGRELLLALAWLLARGPLPERLLTQSHVRLGDEIPVCEVSAGIPARAGIWGAGAGSARSALWGSALPS